MRDQKCMIYFGIPQQQQVSSACSRFLSCVQLVLGGRFVPILTTKRSGLPPILCAWGQTSVVLSTETAVNTNSSEIIATYCAQRDTSSTLSLTVLGTSPNAGDEEDGTLHAGTFPLVDNAYCAMEDVAGTPPLVACVVHPLLVLFLLDCDAAMIATS